MNQRLRRLDSLRIRCLHMERTLGLDEKVANNALEEVISARIPCTNKSAIVAQKFEPR